MRKSNRFSWIALLLFASPLVGQEIIVPEGGTLDIRIVTGTDTVRIVETDTLIVVETDTLVVMVTDTLTVTDTITIVQVDTVFVGDTTSVPPSRLVLRSSGGTIIGQWSDSHGVTHNVRIGPNTGGAALRGSYWMCADVACNSIMMGSSTIPMFRIPVSSPMQDGVMRQAVFPLDDVRPLDEFIASLDGVPGTPLPDDLGWYWLPAGDGEIIMGSS